MVGRQVANSGICIVLGALLFGTAACAGGGDDDEGEAATRAREHIMAAWSVHNESGKVRDSWYRRFDIPSSLVGREEVVLYLLHRAAELDAQASAAYYNLGVYHLDKDCAKATQYFRMHLRVIPGEEDTTSILTRIEECGCDCARDVL